MDNENAVGKRNVELVASINRMHEALNAIDPTHPSLLELPSHSLEIIKQLERNKCADVCRGMADGCDIIHDDNGSDAAHDCARAIEALS